MGEEMEDGGSGDGRGRALGLRVQDLGVVGVR